MQKPTDFLTDEPPRSDFWVFGYGSLIWNPGFDFVEKRVVRISGYRRRFCLRSTRYRGTDEAPGLVLGLDKGGDCLGVAFLVSAANAAGVYAYLYEREMDRYSYRPLWLNGTCPDNDAKIKALCFVVDRQTGQYAGDLSQAETAEIISKARGARGSNLSYLQETVKALQDFGIGDEKLERLLGAVTARQAQP